SPFIRTIETHAREGEVIVRVEELSDANRAALDAAKGIRIERYEEMGAYPDYVFIKVPAEAEPIPRPAKKPPPAREVVKKKAEIEGKEALPKSVFALRSLAKKRGIDVSDIAGKGAKQRIIERLGGEQPTITKPAIVGKPPKAQQAAPPTRWTGVPIEWAGQAFFDWGAKGLRTQGNRYVKVKGGRKRKTFDPSAYSPELTRLLVPTNRKLLNALRRLAPDEIWPVKSRRGKFWSTAYRLVPEQALRRAEEETGISRKQPPPPAKERKANLLGKDVFAPAAGKKQAELGLEPGDVTEAGVGEVAIKPALAKEAVAQLNTPFVETEEDLLLAIRGEYGAEADKLFNNPTEPMLEVHEAFIRASKGGALFAAKPTPTEAAAEAKPKRLISEEAYQKAKKHLGETKLRGGLVPFSFEDVKEATAFILYHIENGVRALGEITREAVEAWKGRLTEKQSRELIHQAWR
ncbi:unnamed protein product, partial [marine sediment metagenome]